MRRVAGIVALVLAVVVAQNATADGVPPYAEFNKKVQAAENVTAFGNDGFGDSVSLYTGSTEFDITDVSLPGNDALPVQLSRRLVVEDRTFDPGNIGGFGDWDFDVPWIEGTFVAEDGWKVSTSGDETRRCSAQAVPDTYSSQTGGHLWVSDVWNGDQLHIPGGGTQELLLNNQSKSPAYASRASYPWVTQSNYKIGCIASLANGYAGEGFKAVSPSGVTYTFNWMVVHAAPNLKLPWTGSVNGYIYIPRSHIFLLATHVQDRFGNYVDYHYSGDHLTGITSSDGRSISLTWNGNTISSVTSESGTGAAQTWTYSYATASATDANGGEHTWLALTGVTRPDGSRWSYSYNGGMILTQPGPDDLLPNQYGCQPTLNPAGSGAFGYTIGAPSGASATFQFAYVQNQRSYVPKSCTGTTGHPNPPANTNYPLVYNFFNNFAIQSKQITGPDLPTMTWSYADTAVGSGGTYYIPSTPWNYDDTTQPYIPPADCSTCLMYKTVTVTGPTSVIKYTFGMAYAHNEGQLLDTEVDDLSGNVLKTTTSAYLSDDDAPGEAFPNIAGQDLLPNYVSPMGNRNRPVVSTQIAQDGASFTTNINSFDAFARGTSETESSSLGYSKTEATTYSDDLNLWVLGLATSTSIQGITVSRTDYDGLDRPVHSYSFGKLVSTKAWNADGTLASVTDGDGNATTLSNWKRGIPQSVTYADNTTQSAVVDDAGRITSVTDESGYTTGYQYDSMGRLKEIDYPSADDVAWNKTFISFAPVGGTEYGIPAGHWKQTIQTGNAKTVTMFDALWRPLVTESLDTTNVSGTLSQTVKRYDAGGRTIFTSYPLSNTALNYATYNTGRHTSYDALNRVTEVDQDSELGTIKTTTAYLSGLKTQVTNPRGYVTTTSYYAYGAPDTSQPHVISAPEGVTTTITRDVFGKPLSITRSGPYNGSTLSATRNYVYDANQQLCKRIDPETGARVMAYDAAGNLQWSAAGLDLPSTSSCDTSTAYSSGRRVDRAYDARNRVMAVTYPDGFSNTSYTYTPDGLAATTRVDNGGQPVTTTYSYDKRRLLTAESLSIPNTSPLALTYGYDANGHLASVTYPDGRSVPYLPNALGQATEAGSYATGVSYYPNGAIKQFTFGNGIVHTMTQDERQLPDRSTESYGGTAMRDNGYDYDADTNVAAITDYLQGNVGNRTMSYDGLDRLTQTVSPMFGGDNTAVYSYDPLDNLRSARVGSVSSFNYQYDTSNRLSGLTDPVTGSSMVSYSYDVQGNVTSKNNQTYQFDEANRLRGVPGVETYLYDAGGRRVQKTQVSGGTVINADYSQAGELMYRAVPAAMNVTDYIYLGGHLVSQVTNNTSSVIGNIDGVPTKDNATIGGWACSTGLDQSINVELYVGGPSGTGTHLGTYTANLASEPAVASSCQANGTNYRFSIPLDSTTRSQYAGQSIYLYGDSPVGNNNNQLDGSGQYTVPANPMPPDAPAQITVPSSSTTGAVTVSWSASANTTNYVLQQSLDGGSWTQVYSGTSTSYALSGLGNGSYQYRVEACNADGCSAFTSSSTLTVALPPPAPASISVPSSSTTGAVTVSWATASTSTSYVLQQSFNGGSWTQVYSGAATSKALSLASGSYKYRVEACNASGCSGFTQSGTLVVTLPPAAPALSGPSSSGSGTFTLSWTAQSGATRYQLNQRLNSGSWSAVYNASGLSWSSSALGNGSYAYVVYACNSAGCSPASNQVTVTVARVPAAPAEVYAPATAAPNTAVTVSWDAVSGATSYNLRESHNGGTPATVYSGSATSATTSPLTLPGSYLFSAQACNANGCSGWTDAPNTTQVKLTL